MLSQAIGAHCGEVKDAVQSIFWTFWLGVLLWTSYTGNKGLMQGVAMSELNPFVCLSATLFSVSGDEEDKS